MNVRACPHSIELGNLVDYLLDELEPAEAERVEDHVFECSSCAKRLESIYRIADAVADAVRHGEVGGTVNDAVVTRATEEGLTVREYRIAPGETVPCAAGPEDLVAVRLSGDFAGFGELTLDTDFLDLETDQQAPTVSRPVLADRDRGEVVLLFPGSLVRTFPRSRWTLTVRGESEEGPRTVGTFVMDHTP
jgi:anti-sigma factor RsiW